MLTDKITDRELLELAAKAAGCVYLTNGQLYVEGKGNIDWNPLTDDGDTLRLASVCKMVIDFEKGTVLFLKDKSKYLWQTLDFIPGDTTDLRLIIVRAAAEIGRQAG